MFGPPDEIAKTEALFYRRCSEDVDAENKSKFCITSSANL